MSLFDHFQDNLLDVVFNTMSYPAQWSPLDGSPAQTATVLFKNPTDAVRIQENQDIESPSMEYKPYDLKGLFESVQKNNTEVITINGNKYYTMRGVKKYDGKTIIIYLSNAEICDYTVKGDFSASDFDSDFNQENLIEAGK